MIVEVGNKKYSVRHNYLHRGQNPRLVLDNKEYGCYVNIQFESNTENPDENVLYRGYWCNKKGHKSIKFRIQ